MPATVLPSF